MNPALALAGLAAMVAACADPAISRTRFRNAPPVWAVNDRQDVAQKPGETHDIVLLTGFDSSIYRRITRPMEVPRKTRALDINALGGVPDSTWFRNRIGRHGLTAKQVARGPVAEPPDTGGVITVEKGKSAGKSSGFFVVDSSGRRYLLKLDHPHKPTLETGIEIAVQRLLWAAGYNVPHNFIAYLRRDQLVVGEGAEVEDALGRERPMTGADLDATLARGKPGPDGRYRVLMSEFLPGIPIGGFAVEGTRRDDPNDTIPHQHRRSLRGLFVFAAWLQHTDLRRGNSLDIWAQDPEDESRHYVVHYLVDFGKSMGAFTVLGNVVDDGHVEPLDLHYLKSAFAFGLWKRPWEGVEAPDHIANTPAFDVEHFRPGDFTPRAVYTPFVHADHSDILWALEILLELRPAHIRAAVTAGEFGDPRAADHLTAVLIGRQKKTARHWLPRINALVDLAVRDRGDGSFDVCFTDLGIQHGVVASQRYRARAYSDRGRPLSRPGGTVYDARFEAGAELPTACAPEVRLSSGADSYTVVRIDGRGEPVEVHVAREPATRRARIIGIHRRL